MEARSRQLPERNLADLLNETFTIYGKHFWRLIGLVAIVELPFSLLTLIPNDGVVVFAMVAIVSLMATIPVIAALVFAVGQHYVMGEIKIGECYSRVAWRAISVLVLGVVLTACVMAGVALMFLIIPGLVVLGFLVYWSMAIQVSIVEGHKSLSALGRSRQLIRGSWRRVSGIWIVILLANLGLGILFSLPSLAIASIVGAESGSTASAILQLVGNMMVATTVPPVTAIASTLLYYDLRVRNEEYDISRLSQEMGLAPA